MAQYNVKLTVDTTQHDRAMERSAGQVNTYAQRVMGAKDKIMGLTKKIPALALAVGTATAAFKGFTAMMNTTDSGADALGRTMEQLKSVTNGFLMSLKTGDFSGFIAGINGIVESAKKAYDAMDALGTHLITSTFAHSVSESKISNLKEIIMDKTKPMEERLKAQQDIITEFSKASKLYDKDIAKFYDAGLTAFQSMTNGMGTKYQFDQFTNLLAAGYEWGDAVDKFLNGYKESFERMGGKHSSFAKQKYEPFIAGWTRLKEKADSDDMQSFIDTISKLYQYKTERSEYGKLINRYAQRKLTEDKGSGGTKVEVPVKIEAEVDDDSIIPVIDSLRDLESKQKVLKEDLEMAIILDDVEQARKLLLDIANLQDKIENKKIELGLSSPKINIPAGPTSNPDDYNAMLENIENLKSQLSNSFNDISSEVLNVSGAFVGLGKTLGDAFNSEGIMKFFESLQSGLDVLNSFYQTYQAIAGIIEVVNSLKETSVALDQAQTAASAASTAASLTQTSADSGAAIAGATKSGAGIPFPYNLIAIATGIAAVVGALSLVGKFADGGIIGGATSVGDMNIARVNKGEMILNQREQNRLFNILSGVDSIGTNGSVSGDVKFRISGSDLVGVLNNQQKKKSRVL